MTNEQRALLKYIFVVLFGDTLTWRRGGFGKRPKFLRHPSLNHLLDKTPRCKVKSKKLAVLPFHGWDYVDGKVHNLYIKTLKLE